MNGITYYCESCEHVGLVADRERPCPKCGGSKGMTYPGFDLTNGATNFSHRLDKATVIFLLQNKLLRPGFDGIMCREYGDDDDWVGVTEDDIETIIGEEYKTFEVWL